MAQYTVEFANSGGLWAAPTHYSLHAESGFNPLFNGPITPGIWTIGIDTSTLEVSKDVLLYAGNVCLGRGSCDGLFHVSLHTGVPTEANEFVESGYEREPLRFSHWRVA